MSVITQITEAHHIHIFIYKVLSLEVCFSYTVVLHRKPTAPGRCGVYCTTVVSSKPLQCEVSYTPTGLSS